MRTAESTDQFCTRQPFMENGIPRNKIPASETDPVGQAILNLYPHCNMCDSLFPLANFRTVILTSDLAWQFDVKLDHQFNSKDRVAGLYSRRPRRLYRAKFDWEREF